MIDVVMPKLGLTMKEGRIVKWLKGEGENVKQGEPLFIVETEKIMAEVEAPASGILRKVIAPEGSVVPVGELVAIITDLGEELPTIKEVIKKQTEEFAEGLLTGKPVVPKVIREKVKVSPLARKLAEEHGVDLTKLEGTGPGGCIVKEDVLRAIERMKIASTTECFQIAEIMPLKGIRKTIAERLSRSYREAVHVPMTIKVDMTEVIKLRERLSHKISLSYTDILVKAVALALRKNPILNSILENDQIKIIRDINIGVAVAVEEGIVVPVVRNADKKSLIEIALCIKDLTEKARQGRLTLDDVSCGTFTLSNLGMFGIDTFAPVINPPQTAILGIGALKDEPTIVNGQISAKPTLSLTLVFDHRVLDGVPAAIFLKTLKEILENPIDYIEID